jgi:hypothetical protein
MAGKSKKWEPYKAKNLPENAEVRQSNTLRGFGAYR